TSWGNWLRSGRQSTSGEARAVPRASGRERPVVPTSAGSSRSARFVEQRVSSSSLDRGAAGRLLGTAAFTLHICVREWQATAGRIAVRKAAGGGSRCCIGSICSCRPRHHVDLSFQSPWRRLGVQELDFFLLDSAKPYCGPHHGRPQRRLSLGEYRRAISWSKYLVSSGGKIKGEGEERWSADMSQLFIGNKFATGRHSRIYHGMYKQREVAIKMMSQPEEDASLAALLEQQFTSEVALLLRLRHQNIVTFVAACKRPPVFCIITEYLAGGSLRKFLHKQEPHSLPLKLVLRLALDIARGMSYLHSQGILHRDLKSENLLLGEDMSVKVADFGISCLESQCGSAKGFMGTYRWMAPEMIKGKQHTRKVDVYSFGIVLWELLTALIPFHDMTPEQAAFAVSQKNARPPIPSTCPPALRHLISQCWTTNPDKRPQFDHIVMILESYIECLEQDPGSFLSQKPVEPHSLLGCFPRCVAALRSPSLEA
ncbi:hypothetical protein Taro_052893, partial [Colocasia esculenta]|nr:hypothetical protein [Colocasia esculenta]